MNIFKIAILVVEDDPLIRLSLVELLESEGYDAVEAVHAGAALAILDVRPDIRLVFTDIRLPGKMDGIALAHEVRRRWPLVQLLVTSGMNLAPESQLPAGTRFFRKPYEPAALLAALAEALEVVAKPPAGMDAVVMGVVGDKG